MIHYHGTPVSGPADVAERFYSGRHCMVSFYAPNHMKLVADACQSFVLDNGAFSFWRTGEQPATWFDDYVGWVSQWVNHPGFDWCLIPDVIDGDESQNDELLRQWPASLRWHGVPVWHYHESLDRLAELCRQWPRVALGSSGEWPNPGTSNWWDRTVHVMRACCDASGMPLCKLHGLRMLNPAVFSRLPLSSADSCNAARNAACERYRLPHAWQRANAIADAVESHQSTDRWGDSWSVQERMLF